MERPERNEKDDAQKAKLIFVSLAALVAIILIWCFYTVNKVKHERDTAKQETEMARSDNAKLEQMLKDQNQIIDDLKKKEQLCEAKARQNLWRRKLLRQKRHQPRKLTSQKRPGSQLSAMENRPHLCFSWLFLFSIEIGEDHE
jgi:hypothetical protein